MGRKIDVNQIVQDTDVLDTWFSSALIPLSVSGWPDSDVGNFFYRKTHSTFETSTIFF